VPGPNGGPSTTASDIMTTVTQLLGPSAPDLHMASPPGSAEIALMGNPQSIRLAEELIKKLDRPQPLVVLDTEIVEVDESASRYLGLQLSGSVGTTFTEITPPVNTNVGLQSLTRTPLAFAATLNMLVNNGQARVLSDPRISTISGHEATIHAGDNLSILTQTAGGVGTPVTSQVQTFNTGVSLDITPIVGSDGMITVALHPVVNSVASVDPTTHIPDIATRDTQTVVQLADNQTLVIGGLIQESKTRATNKIPLLGEIPLIGRLFDSSDNEYSRNELIIVVTPHVVRPGQIAPPAVRGSIPLEHPVMLPTLPPGTVFPAPAPSARRTPIPYAAPATPALPSATPTPIAAPTPPAFAKANIFTYGTLPRSTYARPEDLPQIFFAKFSPTVVSNGTSVTVSVITTTNVTNVVIAWGTSSVALAKLGASTWQATFPFNATGSPTQTTAQMTLTAYRSDGAHAQIQIPVNVSQLAP
jgi:hypothetical protein